MLSILVVVHLLPFNILEPINTFKKSASIFKTIEMIQAKFIRKKS